MRNLLLAAAALLAACSSESEGQRRLPSFRWDQPSYTIAVGANEVAATGRAIPGDEPLPDHLTFGLVPLDDGIAGHYTNIVEPAHCADGCTYAVTFERWDPMLDHTAAPGTYHVRVGFAVNEGGAVHEYADDVGIVVE